MNIYYAQTKNVWFPYLQRKSGARVRLFCFPYAGGGASIFRTWSENVPPNIEVCPVQFPGRENRVMEPPFTNLNALLASLMPSLLPYLDMPYAFFGHSMGALVSFELARLLRRMNHKTRPIYLFVSGRRAPDIQDIDPPSHNLTEPAFIEEIRRLKGTPEEVLQNAELLKMVIPLLRADFALCETYTYEKELLLKCPLSVFGGLQDKDVTREAISAWQKQTSCAFKMHFFAGDHFFLRKERYALLHVITQSLLPLLYSST
ncbi:thioesterase II family protein [Dictyobacter formicarum]|uniref:thioesterase II family protein n=1 Tax=Dictyobacter formicarum TaxID=2778368 RepID=UPI0019169AC6|nr:thioesterase II family protein [Dictyobacter formicarum]